MTWLLAAKGLQSVVIRHTTLAAYVPEAKRVTITMGVTPPGKIKLSHTREKACVGFDGPSPPRC